MRITLSARIGAVCGIGAYVGDSTATIISPLTESLILVIQ